MQTALIFILFALGIVLIVKGGDIFVDAATWIAEVTGIPKFIIGATIVSMATTLPELIVSLIAAVDGKVDMAIGNAVGSVTANIGLIMAISLIFMPAVIKRRSFAFKAILMTVSAASLYLLCLSGEMKIYGAAFMLVLFVIFIVENVSDAKKSMVKGVVEVKVKGSKRDYLINILKFIIGAAGIVWGADLLVDNGSAIASLIGVPESIIGVTVIAIGTSLPELVTTITAIAKKQSNLSIGNIIGANIIDLTVILPLCSFVSGGSLPVASQTLSLDMPACMLVCAIAVVPPLIISKLRRWQGVALITVYTAYLVMLCLYFV